jgi:N-dimethylarginine dimethylaminohydrolase
MCRPSFFGVDYVINPWMEDQVGQANHALAEQQWNALHAIFADVIGVQIELIAPVQGLPDLVFTANAGLVHEKTFLISRFKHPERQGEEGPFEDWFRAHGFEVRCVPGYHEGAGDMLFWTDVRGRSTLFCAYGFRSDEAIAQRVSNALNVETVRVKLVDSRYYHIDTCFCPLPGGGLLWHPSAFDANSQAAIREAIPVEDRYEVASEDAALFACNAVALDMPEGTRHIVMGHCGEACHAWLAERGFEVHITPLGEFLKAGGSAKCLTIRLDSGLV